MNHIRAWRHRIQLPYRIQATLLALAALLTHALWPGVAWAGCGVTDFSACADDAQYTVWYGAATFLWAIDAMLLQLAYLVDVFRVWVVETAFTSAYQVLITLVNPLIVPFATIALIIAVLLFLLTPLFGRIRSMNVRHVLVWALIAPLLLTVSGPLIVQVEQARTGLGAAIFTDVSAIAPGAIFGVASTDMAAPTPLYGGNPCGSGALARPGAGVNPASLHMDDLAAAMLWANAQDIHCPKSSGPGQDIPDAFYVDPPDGPGFATTNKVGDMNDSSERATAIQNIQRGVTRLALGILPSLLAVLEMLVNLVFGLSLVALWLGLPLGLAFIFFEESSASIAMLLRQGFGVLKVSWASSFLMAILFAALKSSAEMGNAAAYTGLAGGSIILMGWLLITAFGTLSGSVKTLSSSVMTGTGLNIMQPVELAAGAATVAAGALTGGAALAATAAAAYQQTGSGRYAAGAAAGRIGNLAQLGEVAAAMGWVQDDEVVAGLHAGDRSTQSYRSMRLQMVTDARRKGDDGLTMPERAQERGVTRQLGSATHTGAWRSINAGAAAAGAAVGDAYDYMRSGQGLQDAHDGGSRLLESIGDSWHRTRQGVAQFGAEVDARANAAGPSALGELGMVTRGAAAAIAVTHDRLSPDGRHQAYRLDDHGQMQRMQRQDGDGALPPDARTVPNTAANLPRLLRQGYAVQQNLDQTVTIWQADPQKASAAGAEPEKQLAQLYKDGALDQDAMKRAAAETIASGTPSAGPPPQKYLEVPPPDAGVYHVREMADGQVQAQHQVDSAAAVAELAAERGLSVRMVAPLVELGNRAPETTVGGWRVIDMGSHHATVPISAAPQTAAPVPTAPGTQSRVERLAASRGAQVQAEVPTVPAGAASAAPSPAEASQSPAAVSQLPNETPTAPALPVANHATPVASQVSSDAPTAPAHAESVAPPLSESAMSQAARVISQAPNAIPTVSQPAAVTSPAPSEAPTVLVGAALPPMASAPQPAAVVNQTPIAELITAPSVIAQAALPPMADVRQPMVMLSQTPIRDPITSTQVIPQASPPPAVLPAPAARWLDQVGHQVPITASPTPAISPGQPLASGPGVAMSRGIYEVPTMPAVPAPPPVASPPAQVVNQASIEVPTMPATPSAQSSASRPAPVVSQTPIEVPAMPATSVTSAPAVVPPAPAASRPLTVASQGSIEVPTMPAASVMPSPILTVNHAPAAVPAPSTEPATHQPTQTGGQEPTQEQETPAAVPAPGTEDTLHTDTEKRAH